METINQKEYLKKYLGIGRAPGEKKKKKKIKGAGNRVKIIDDDADTTFATNVVYEDPLLVNEDAPQIVAIIDERPPSLRVDEKTKNPLWQPIGTTETTSATEQKQMITGFKIAPKNSDKIFARPSDRSPPRRRKVIDRSPPRKEKNKEYLSPRTKVEDDNKSPPTRNRDDTSPKKKTEIDDISPSRKSRNGDSSPARKSKSEDYSPPRKSRNDDISPPRKNRKSDEDYSPPRKFKQNSLSPPRKPRNDDISPPRKQRKSNEDYSPPRKVKHHNLSPSRSSRSRDVSPSRKQKNDISPPRKTRKFNDSSPTSSKHSVRSKTPDQSPNRKHKRDKTDNKEDKKTKYNEERRSSKMEKTLDGKAAGLQNAQQLAEETKQFRSREDQLFKNLPQEASGQNAETVFRDRKSGKIRNLEEEEERQRKKREEEEKNKEKYTRWGRGLVQVENRDQKIQEELHEMSKPLARYADDEDLEKFLKEQEREGDPMLAYIRSKKRKEAAKAGVLTKPEFEGQFMPNRFGIKPGHRWDGVDRSNGYEKRWFEVQNAKRAQQEETYKWSTEDM